MAMDEILLQTEEAMDDALEYLKREFRGIRTGRASGGLVEHIKVDYYGSPTDLRQLAAISTPEANLIVIKPFDPGSFKEIERAIQASDLGITPAADGKVIRLTIPPLSGERRQQLVTQVKKMSEQTRVAVRNARRDANKEIDSQQKAGDLTEDEAKRGKDDVQKLTKKYEDEVTKLVDAKTEEIEEL
ncbi:MAG: ribosome recycling factor [Phycisphaerae bacterium]